MFIYEPYLLLQHGATSSKMPDDLEVSILQYKVNSKARMEAVESQAKSNYMLTTNGIFDHLKILFLLIVVQLLMFLVLFQ